jgi:uncharacterized protein YegP (UPF0339 family)
MSARYEIFQGTNQQHYFRLKASNGEIILQSEGYVSQAGAENGVDSVRRHSPFDKYYVKEESRDGQFYFVLMAENHQVIGVSQMYVSTSGRDVGIASVKANGPNAPLYFI